MSAIPDTKMLCRDQFCVGTTGPCRPKEGTSLLHSCMSCLSSVPYAAASCCATDPRGPWGPCLRLIYCWLGGASRRGDGDECHDWFWVEWWSWRMLRCVWVSLRHHYQIWVLVFSSCVKSGKEQMKSRPQSSKQKLEFWSTLTKRVSKFKVPSSLYNWIKYTCKIISIEILQNS